jgi:hypothetical protein
MPDGVSVLLPRPGLRAKRGIPASGLSLCGSGSLQQIVWGVQSATEGSTPCRTKGKNMQKARPYLRPGERVLAALLARPRGATMPGAGMITGMVT